MGVGLLFIVSTVDALTPEEPPWVLVLHSLRTTLPANTDWYDGIVQGLDNATGPHLHVAVEAPDLSARGEQKEYIENLVEIYGRKYGDDQPDVIVATFTPALQFLLDHGNALFPGSPVVFCGADSHFVANQVLPQNFTGVTSAPDFEGTLNLALEVHPHTKTVVIVVGSGPIGRQWTHDITPVLPSFSDRVEFLWLQGLPVDELREQVAKLTGPSVILYVVQHEDRTGAPLIPARVAELVSKAAKVPVYGLWDTLVGHGILGGRLMQFQADGYRAGQMASRIIRGTPPAAIPAVFQMENEPVFDAEQLDRWDIDLNSLPAGSVIRNFEPSLWDRYRRQIIIIGTVLLVQFVLIVALFASRGRLHLARRALDAESARLRTAESMIYNTRERLAKLTKERSLGAMATTIAHEINQPLIAIQNYAQAAKRRFDDLTPQPPKLAALLDKIEGQAERAGEIIKKIQVVVGSDRADLQPVSLNSIVEKVLELMEPTFIARGCRIEYRPGVLLPSALADALQIQLVLVNLLQNAINSMDTTDRANKLIRIETTKISDRQLSFSVSDRGSGIPPDRVEGIFDPLYSGGRTGMGMGLAICKKIMDVHGGDILYEPDAAGGSRFDVRLRVAAA